MARTAQVAPVQAAALFEVEALGPERRARVLLPEPLGVAAEDEGLRHGVHLGAEVDLAEVVSVHHRAEIVLDGCSCLTVSK